MTDVDRVGKQPGVCSWLPAVGRRQVVVVQSAFDDFPREDGVVAWVGRERTRCNVNWEFWATVWERKKQNDQPV